MDFLGELWAFMKERKKFWLMPAIVAALLFGFLVFAVIAHTGSLAPFIYSLF